MFNQEDVAAMLKGIDILNDLLGPWAVIIPVVFVVLVLALLINAYRNPGRKSSGILLGFMAFVYLYSGGTILAGISALGGSIAWVGAIALWIVALLLVLDVIFHWTEVRWPERLDLKILSVFFMGAGIFLYPLVEMALGFTWPRMVLFGAECPTTIFLIGLLIGCTPRVNKPLFVLISLNAIATGFSVALNGAPFDTLYGLAGLAGTFILIKDFKSIFGKRPS